jgi:hypothetical protein
MHLVYKQQATLGRELSLEWERLLPILAQDHAYCIIWLGFTFAELATTQPVISSQAPCWPRILLVTEPLRKGISVCTLTWTFGEFDTESGFQVEEDIHVQLPVPIVTTDPATSLLNSVFCSLLIQLPYIT